MQIQRFDLSQISWKAFRWEEMFSRRWYLRRERLSNLTLYPRTLTVVLTSISKSFTRVLKGEIEGASKYAAHVRISDIHAASILSVSALIPALLLFNVEYFLLQFWPARTYSARYLAWKKAVFVAVACGMVIVAMRSASITGVSDPTARQLTALYTHPPLRYRSWTHNIIWLVLLWAAAALSVASTTLLVMALPQERAAGMGASASSETDEKIGAPTPDASANCNVLPNADGKAPSSVSKR
ncbi:hypothetical protein BJ912DRAFT_937605 [Pholiota molesta]|nr:hypothetical protein BJ912DRAFT_937605 [Pholiota molesta]